MERRAFKQAYFSVQDEEAALDLVQEAMMRVADRYADNPIAEFPMLFQRILQNAIRDYFRRQKARSPFSMLLSFFKGDSEESDEGFDPLDVMELDPISIVLEEPDQQLDRQKLLQLIEEALTSLPARQREAFLLRYWEELDVAETAQMMGCSEGSVKTHCSRATKALADFLTKKGVHS